MKSHRLWWACERNKSSVSYWLGISSESLLWDSYDTSYSAALSLSLNIVSRSSQCAALYSSKLIQSRFSFFAVWLFFLLNMFIYLPSLSISLPTAPTHLLDKAVVPVTIRRVSRWKFARCRFDRPFVFVSFTEWV